MLRLLLPPVHPFLRKPTRHSRVFPAALPRRLPAADQLCRVCIVGPWLLRAARIVLRGTRSGRLLRSGNLSASPERVGAVEPYPYRAILNGIGRSEPGLARSRFSAPLESHRDMCMPVWVRWSLLLAFVVTNSGCTGGTHNAPSSIDLTGTWSRSRRCRIGRRKGTASHLVGHAVRKQRIRACDVVDLPAGHQRHVCRDPERHADWHAALVELRFVTRRLTRI